MEAGYTISERGLDNFSTIWVFNFPNSNEVDTVKWDGTDHVDKLTDPYLVAIFKIKPKAKCNTP